jgi:hypothetical protein
MDFIGIIRSLEELLYEVMSWLIFYPRTMLRILINPTRMTLYSDSELNDTPTERYADSLSPPMLLMLTIALTHGIELAVGLKGTSELRADSVLAGIMANEKNLLIVRALITAIIPMVIALIAMRAQRQPLDRNTLRQPFFSQCFLATPFAFAISMATVLGRRGGDTADSLAIALGVAAFIWLCWAETRWFARQQDLGAGAALLAGVGSVIAALTAALLVALAMTVLL